MIYTRRFLDLRLSIDGVVTAPSTGAKVGTQYLVAASGTTGAFAGHENQVAQLTDKGWEFFSINKTNTELFDITSGRIYRSEIVTNKLQWVAYSFGGTNDNDVNELLSKRILLSVDAVARVGTGAPPSAEKDKVFVNRSARSVTYTTENQTGVFTWTTSVPLVEGSRYISELEHKLYVVDESLNLIEELVSEGAIVISKHTNRLYTYSKKKFVEITPKDIELDIPPAYITKSVMITIPAAGVRQFTLPEKILSNNGINVFVGGVLQTPGVDYSINTTSNPTLINWVSPDVELDPELPTVVTYTIEK